MSLHRLAVVSCPEDLAAAGISFLAPRFVGPVIIGTSTEDHACGHCGEVLFAKIAASQVSHMTVRCFACGECNRVQVPATH